MSRTPAAMASRAEAPAAPPAGRISVEMVRDLDLRPQDRFDVDALVASRPEVGVFLSRAWLSGHFADPPEGFDPCLVLLRDGQALRGVVPIALGVTGRHVRIRLLGGGLGSDRVDLLAVRGSEAACADALIAWLGEAFGRRAVTLELRDLPADSPLWGAVHRVNAAGPRLALQPREIYTLPYLDLADPVTRQSGLLLKALDKHRRWLERRGRLRIETLHDHGEVMAAFASLTGFLHARWCKTPGGSALDRPAAQRFHRHALPRLLGDGRLRMIRLSSDMRTIAVFYGLAVHGWRGYYLAGYDREWAGRIHLGQITLAAAIDAACREGAVEFDFLKGVERVKYLWPVRERSTLDADVYSGHAASQVGRAARAVRDAAGAMVKSARSLLSAKDPR